MFGPQAAGRQRVLGDCGRDGPSGDKGEGTLYATALFVGGDEVAVSTLGVAKSPVDYPLSSHANALAAHPVYGVTTE